MHIYCIICLRLYEGNGQCIILNFQCYTWYILIYIYYTLCVHIAGSDPEEGGKRPRSPELTPYI